MAGQQVYVHCDLSCAQICTLDMHMHSHGIDRTWYCKAGVLKYTFVYSVLFIECSSLFNLFLIVHQQVLLPIFYGPCSVHSVAALCMLA